jgi:hypothetical protein
MKYQPTVLGRGEAIAPLRAAVQLEFERVRRALSELEADRVLLSPNLKEPRRELGVIVACHTAQTWNGQSIVPGLYAWGAGAWRQVVAF